jgi:hypothetical protein
MVGNEGGEVGGGGAFDYLSTGYGMGWLVGILELDWLMLLPTSDGTLTSVDRLEGGEGAGEGKEMI